MILGAVLVILRVEPWRCGKPQYRIAWVRWVPRVFNFVHAGESERIARVSKEFAGMLTITKVFNNAHWSDLILKIHIVASESLWIWTRCLELEYSGNLCLHADNYLLMLYNLTVYLKVEIHWMLNVSVHYINLYKSTKSKYVHTVCDWVFVW